MNLAILKNSWVRFFILPYLIFSVFVIIYGPSSQTFPVLYQDEFFWVGRSFFFQPFIQGDFKNEVWQTGSSFDQPKLAELTYGAWLYAYYLRAQLANQTSSDYVQFLIQRGFYYEVEDTYRNQYPLYKKYPQSIRYKEIDEGQPDYYLAKYGPESMKTLELIYEARSLNIFLLALAVVMVYFFALQYFNEVMAVIFSLGYGLNKLIISSGLIAYSEALFLLTFNAAILFMQLFFTKGRKTSYLIMFSIFAGLCTATKLNGVMLLGFFMVINLIFGFMTRQKDLKQNLVGLIPIIISLVIFIGLNPFTYSSPIQKIKYMFEWRNHMASEYLYHPDNIYAITSPFLRVGKIFENFYFSYDITLFSGTKFLEQIVPPTNSLGIGLALLFLIGFCYLLKQSFRKNHKAIILISIFILMLGSMSVYLKLNWDRYYVQLVLFLYLFQFVGAIRIFNLFAVGSKNLRTRIFPSQLKPKPLELPKSEMFLKD